MQKKIIDGWQRGKVEVGKLIARRKDNRWIIIGRVVAIKLRRAHGKPSAAVAVCENGHAQGFGGRAAQIWTKKA